MVILGPQTPDLTYFDQFGTSDSWIDPDLPILRYLNVVLKSRGAYLGPLPEGSGRPQGIGDPGAWAKGPLRHISGDPGPHPIHPIPGDLDPWNLDPRNLDPWNLDPRNLDPSDSGPLGFWVPLTR